MGIKEEIDRKFEEHKRLYGNKELKEEFENHEKKLILEVEQRNNNKIENIISKAHIKSIFKSLDIEKYYNNAELFYNFNPFFYDKSGLFWMWDPKESKYEIVDEIDLMNKLDYQLMFHGETIKGKHKNQYIEALKRVGRLKHPKNAPIKWIQFKDKAFSIKSNKIYKVEPNYFFTNPIPWELGTSGDTPILDKLFSEWVGNDNLKDLYEFIAYCCYREYPIQLLFCLYGHGRNGKSSFIKIVDKFLGSNNTTTTDLDMIAGKYKSRFETFKMYKKLACFMGETNFGVLESSSILKKLVGGDKMGIEVKGKTPFDDYNYAKIIIASNSLPTSEDTSEGFYRRWHIIRFPNQFPEGRDVCLNIPDSEFNNLAYKVTQLLPNLILKGEFTNQGTIEDRKERYIMASNPLPTFIKQFCIVNTDKYCRYSNLYVLYSKFLEQNKRRIISKKEFSKHLNEEGMEVRKTSYDGIIDYYVEGCCPNPNFLDFPNFSLKDIGIEIYIKEVPKKSNQGNEENLYRNIPQINIYNPTLDNLKQHIELYPIDNIDGIIELFGQKEVDKWLKEGSIMESPAGTYKILN